MSPEQRTGEAGAFAALPRRRPRVKVCGLTRPMDALAAEAVGVDAVGVVFAEGSKRRVDLAQAAEVLAPLGPFVTRVGVFTDARPDELWAAVERLRLDAVQLHGQLEPAQLAALRVRVRVIKAVSWTPSLDLRGLAELPVDALHVDGPQAGSGRSFAWGEAAADGLARLPRWVLAGGLQPENVAAAAEALRPWAVDVSTGVESAPGLKDPLRMAAFMAAVASLGAASPGDAGPGDAAASPPDRP